MYRCCCNGSQSAPLVVKTVVFIRHGEAIHNIEEPRAQKCAGAQAEALGHAKGSAAHKAMCEEARKAVLKNEVFRDAPLSEAGTSQAVACKEELVKLLESMGIEEPKEVLVSPLQRTLQTVAEVFPDSADIRVCEQLRERRTGAPCDEPSRCMVQHQSLDQTNRASLRYLEEAPSVPNEGLQGIDLQTIPLEDAPMLRCRTARLANILEDCCEQTVCVVGHKGYFRELERGPFGRPMATEFGNCEVRIYDVTLPGDGTMTAMLRYCKGERELRTSSKHNEVTHAQGETQAELKPSGVVSARL